MMMVPDVCGMQCSLIDNRLVAECSAAQPSILSPSMHLSIQSAIHPANHIRSHALGHCSSFCMEGQQKRDVMQDAGTNEALGEMEREFLGEPSESSLDEEELNRCSDDEVDADFES